MYTGNGWYHDGIITRDLWASSNGTSWELILGSTPYDPFAKLIVFHDRILAIKESVWSSGNGTDGNMELASLPFNVNGEVYLQ